MHMKSLQVGITTVLLMGLASQTAASHHLMEQSAPEHCSRD